MKAIFYFLAVFLWLFCLAFLSCESDTNSTSSEQDNDQSASGFAKADDDDDDDDNNNDDDDNNDNDDDTSPPEDPTLFLIYTSSSYLLTENGWERHTFPTKPPISSDSEIVPLFMLDGSKGFAAWNYTQWAEYFCTVGFNLMTFEVSNGWGWEPIIKLGINLYLNNIEMLHAANEDVWYGVQTYFCFPFNEEFFVKYSYGLATQIHFPLSSPRFESFFFTEPGEGLVSAYDYSLDSGVIYKFHQGQYQAISLPTGYEDWFLKSIWLTDSNNGWAVAETEESHVFEELFKYQNGQFSHITAPTGCEYCTPKKVMFSDESFGVVTGVGTQYRLFENGSWFCKELPFKIQQKRLHVVRPGLYYIGGKIFNAEAVLFEIRDGIVDTVELPLEFPVFAGIHTVGENAPRFSPP